MTLTMRLQKSETHEEGDIQDTGEIRERIKDRRKRRRREEREIMELWPDCLSGCSVGFFLVLPLREFRADRPHCPGGPRRE